MSISQIADKTNSSASWHVEQMLQDALKEHLEGEWQGANKAMVIWLDDRDGHYRVGWSQAQMHLTELLSLLEIAKQSVFREMGK